MNTFVNTILSVESPAFKHNDFIPSMYTCHGRNINPPITINYLPEEAVSLALIIEDPDAPGGTYDHWIMWNIPSTSRIEENSVPGIQGMNSLREFKYQGPCPPAGSIHHYHFKVYALDAKLDVEQRIHKKELLHVMEDHIVAYGEMIGLYKK